MIVSIAMNRTTALDLSALKAAYFHEQGEEVVMDTGSMLEKMEALEEVKEIEKKLNDDYAKAMTFIENGQYKEAIEPTRELLNNIADDTVVVYLCATLAELYYATGDYLNCALTCKNIVKDGNDTDGTYQFMRGMSYLQTQDFKNAVKDLTILIDEDKSNTEYLYNRGVAYMAQEKYKKAAADYKKALNLKMKEIGCLYNYGICAIMSEDYENGVEALEKVIERNESKEFTKGAEELLKQISIAIEESMEEALEEA